VKSLSTEASQDEIQCRECSETTSSRLKELQDAWRCGTLAHALECEQGETRVASSISGSSPSPLLPSDSIARGEEIRQQGELAGW
jgi:hypothetical protein